MWDRTIRVNMRLREALGEMWHSGHGRVVRTFKGRHIIGRDMSVIEGIYPGAGVRESIVVSEKDGKLLRCFYDLFGSGNWTAWDAERAIYNRVQDIFGGSASDIEKRVEKLCADHGLVDDRKVDLTFFMDHGIGVCRHRALLATYLLEKFIQKGALKGKVSIDRNDLPGLGGHAWARYTDVRGGVFIIDASLLYLDYLSQAKDHHWDYRRPEDKVFTHPKPPPTATGGNMANPANPLEIRDEPKPFLAFTKAGQLFVIGSVVLTACVLVVTFISIRTNDAEVVALKEANHKALSDKDVDVEAQKRLVEKAQADLEAMKKERDTCLLDNVALGHELDLDDDGVKNVDDKCPTTVFVEGGPHSVNTFGCSEIEVALSCGSSSPRLPGEAEQYSWADCTLNDRPDEVDYVCTVHFGKEGFETPTECHEAPFILNADGSKTRGG